MLNPKDLEKGDMVVSLKTNSNGVKEGEVYRVVSSGRSWGSYYADIAVPVEGYNTQVVEINDNNFKDFNKV